jgi:hypothetical protein
MKIGIVGSEAAKFTQAGEEEARRIIRVLLQPGDEVVSGGCHLGGIDIWAVEEAHKMGLYCHQYIPAVLSWEGGYKPRNILIAEQSDVVFCITVDQLPDTYDGMTFATCYHCHTTNHVKSGGCWTTKYARKLGKQTDTLVVRNL